MHKTHKHSYLLTKVRAFEGTFLDLLSDADLTARVLRAMAAQHNKLEPLENVTGQEKRTYLN